jgi:hypothetical protein
MNRATTTKAGRVWRINLGGRRAGLVCAPSRAVAARLAGFGSSAAKNWISETGNGDDIAVARRFPGRLLVAPMSGPGRDVWTFEDNSPVPPDPRDLAAVAFVLGCINESEAGGHTSFEDVESGEVPDGATPDEVRADDRTIWLLFGDVTYRATFERVCP